MSWSRAERLGLLGYLEVSTPTSGNTKVAMITSMQVQMQLNIDEGFNLQKSLQLSFTFYTTQARRLSVLTKDETSTRRGAGYGQWSPQRVLITPAMESRTSKCWKLSLLSMPVTWPSSASDRP